MPMVASRPQVRHGGGAVAVDDERGGAITQGHHRLSLGVVAAIGVAHEKTGVEGSNEAGGRPGRDGAVSAQGRHLGWCSPSTAWPTGASCPSRPRPPRRSCGPCRGEGTPRTRRGCRGRGDPQGAIALPPGSPGWRSGRWEQAQGGGPPWSPGRSGRGLRPAEAGWRLWPASSDGGCVVRVPRAFRPVHDRLASVHAHPLGESARDARPIPRIRERRSERDPYRRQHQHESGEDAQDPVAAGPLEAAAHPGSSPMDRVPVAIDRRPRAQGGLGHRGHPMASTLRCREGNLGEHRGHGKRARVGFIAAHALIGHPWFHRAVSCTRAMMEPCECWWPKTTSGFAQSWSGVCRERYVVDAVEDGEIAMQFLRSYEYDAVILDWRMPGMSGIEVVRALRRRGSSVPVLLLTALDTPRTGSQALTKEPTTISSSPSISASSWLGSGPCSATRPCTRAPPRCGGRRVRPGHS